LRAFSSGSVEELLASQISGATFSASINFLRAWASSCARHLIAHYTFVSTIDGPPIEPDGNRGENISAGRVSGAT
jgi:hypothetical protein